MLLSFDVASTIEEDSLSAMCGMPNLANALISQHLLSMSFSKQMHDFDLAKVPLHAGQLIVQPGKKEGLEIGSNQQKGCERAARANEKGMQSALSEPYCLCQCFSTGV